MTWATLAACESSFAINANFSTAVWRGHVGRAARLQPGEKCVILQGNAPSITQIFDLKIATGREFNETDTEHHAPVVLLGFDTTNLLSP